MDMVREIAFLNRGAMDSASFAFAVEAIRIQYERDVYPVWSNYTPVKRPCVVVGYTDSVNLAPGSFAPIEIVRQMDPGALGDHGGISITDEAWGRSLPDSTVMSHEAVELAVDPFGDRWVRLPSGLVVALEASDPVENDRYTITASIGGQSRDVEVSNFVYPSWFSEGGGTQFDHMGLCKAAGENRGYLIVEQPDGTTINVFASHATPEYEAKVNAKQRDLRSRTARRFRSDADRTYITPGVMGAMEWTAP